MATATKKRTRERSLDDVLITIDREALLDALIAVQGIVPTRSPKPILQSVKLDVDPDSGSTLLSTDLEVAIRRRVLGVTAPAARSLILPPARLRAILSTSSAPTVDLIAAAAEVTIQAGGATYHLPLEDPSLYPSPPDFQSAAYYSMDSGPLRMAIRRTMFATDIESTRYALGGALLEFAEREGVLAEAALVATDGRRLARQVIAAEAVGEPVAAVGPVVVPTKALKLIERGLRDDDPPTHLAVTRSDQGTAIAVLVRTERATVYTRLVEGRFPRYQDVFPATPATRVTVRAGDLRRAAEQAQITTSDESRGVTFQFSGGEPPLVQLSSQAIDVGESLVECPLLRLDGPDLAVRFDVRYVTEMLRALDEATELTVKLIDANAAVLIETEDRYQHIIMPLALES